MDDRKRIKAYFMRFDLNLFILILITSSMLTSIADTVSRFAGSLASTLNIIAIVLPLSYIAKSIYFIIKSCDETTVDHRISSDLVQVKNILKEKTNLNYEDVLNKFNIIVPLKRSGGITFKQMLFGGKPPFIKSVKGQDGKYRYTPFLYQDILCFEEKLVVVTSTLDVLTGNLLDTITTNIYFDEITAYTYKDDTDKSVNWFWFINYLKNMSSHEKIRKKNNIEQGRITEVNLSSTFLIESKSGNHVEIKLPVTYSIDNVSDDKIHSSNAHDTIMAIQKMIDDKKIA